MWTSVLLFVGGAIAAAGGVGGGGLYVPILILAGGFEPHEAVPLSKVIVFGASLASLTRWRHIDLDVAILLEPATLVGAVAGVLLNQLLPPRALLPALVCVLGVTSARTLLAILRLSQALARLRCAHEVVREDIVEARRLMTLSKSSIYDAADGDADGAKNKVDPVSVVYQIIREHARANRLPAVNVSEILPKVLSRGRTKEDLERCMAEYEELDVWQVNADRTIIRFVDDGDNY